MADIKLEDIYFDPNWGNKYNFKDRNIGGNEFPYDDSSLKNGDYGRQNHGQKVKTNPQDREKNFELMKKFGNPESAWDEIKEILGVPFSNVMGNRSSRGSFYTGMGGAMASFNPNKEPENDPNDDAEIFGKDLPISFGDVMVLPVPKDNSIIGKDDSVWADLVKMTRDKKYLENK